jgi:FKBP-type peptidyl-prolyl cis-trans isomerase
MNKKTYVAVAIAIIVIFVFIGGKSLLNTMISGQNQGATNNNQQVDNATTTANQVQINDTTVGTGDEAVTGKEVTVNYTGVFTDGKKFDSSLDRGVPFTFKLGSGMVIKGWDIGIQGMKVGGKRILVIPPEFGYGANDYGPIPGNSTLIFEVELLGVK